MGIKESISELRQKFDADLSEVRDSESIEKLRVSYLGKKGSVTELLKGLKDLSGAEKKEFGQTINTLKREVDERITAHVERIRQEEEDRLVNSAEQYAADGYRLRLLSPHHARAARAGRNFRFHGLYD